MIAENTSEDVCMYILSEFKTDIERQAAYKMYFHTQTVKKKNYKKHEVIAKFTEIESKMKNSKRKEIIEETALQLNISFKAVERHIYNLK